MSVVKVRAWGEPKANDYWISFIAGSTIKIQSFFDGSGLSYEIVGPEEEGEVSGLLPAGDTVDLSDIITAQGVRKKFLEWSARNRLLGEKHPAEDKDLLSDVQEAHDNPEPFWKASGVPCLTLEETRFLLEPDMDLLKDYSIGRLGRRIDEFLTQACTKLEIKGSVSSSAARALLEKLHTCEASREIRELIDEGEREYDLLTFRNRITAKALVLSQFVGVLETEANKAVELLTWRTNVEINGVAEHLNRFPASGKAFFSETPVKEVWVAESKGVLVYLVVMHKLLNEVRHYITSRFY